MPDQPPKSDADRTRGSIKEAIGKITGDRKAIREGAVEKNAAVPDTLIKFHEHRSLSHG